MSRRAKLASGVVVLALAVAGLAVVVASRGRYDAVARAAPGQTKPSWSRPCDAAAFVDVTWSQCARVEGRTVWVEGRDPDGDGDRHLVLISHWDVRLVKIARGVAVSHPLRVGERVTAVGPVVLGSHGRHEVDAQALEIRGAAGL